MRKFPRDFLAAAATIVWLTVLPGGLAWSGEPSDQTLDIQRAKELYRRSQQGERLSAEDGGLYGGGRLAAPFWHRF